jgi:hypothetical protein
MVMSGLGKFLPPVPGRTKTCAAGAENFSFLMIRDLFIFF